MTGLGRREYLSVASSDPDDGSDACSSYGVVNVTFFSFHVLTWFFIILASSFRASSWLSASFSHSFQRGSLTGSSSVFSASTFSLRTTSLDLVTLGNLAHPSLNER
jgi:hypothetical protein